MAADHRKSARTVVLLRAMIDGEGFRIPVRVSNLSKHGARVIGDGLPSAETQIMLHCNGCIVAGWITWKEDGSAGVQFAHPVQPQTLTRRAAPQVLIVKDTRKTDFRRPGFRGNQMTDEERKIVEEWTGSQKRKSKDEI